jgi:hypothetical protein
VHLLQEALEVLSNDTVATGVEQRGPLFPAETGSVNAPTLPFAMITQPMLERAACSGLVPSYHSHPELRPLHPNNMGVANTGIVCVAPTTMRRPRDGDAIRKFRRFNSVL